MQFFQVFLYIRQTKNNDFSRNLIRKSQLFSIADTLLIMKRLSLALAVT